MTSSTAEANGDHMKKVVGTWMLALLLVFGVKASQAQVFFQDNFESHTNSLGGTGISGWGAQATLDSTGGYNGSKAAKVSYNSAGVNAGVYLDTSAYPNGDVYIRFYSKVDCGSGACLGGSKFLKLFGVNDSAGGYANSTFAINYDTGHIDVCSYGNGTTYQNDTQTGAFLSGGGWDAGIQTPVTVNSITFTDKQWHCYEVYMKYSTDSNMDGMYKLWKDGTLVFQAQNLKNRYNGTPPNPRRFASIQLGGYSSQPQWQGAYNIWFDEIVISDSYVGPIGSATKPAPPTNLSVR